MQERLNLKHDSLERFSSDMTAQRGVRAAFELSWDALNEDSQKLSCLLSLFAPAPIPWNLVEECLSDINEEYLENRRDELINYNLLEDKDNYRLHALIREFFIDKLKDSDSIETTKITICKGVVKIAETANNYEHITPKKVTEFEDFTPHIIEVAENLYPSLTNDNLITPFWALGWFYLRPGFYSYSQSWLKKGREILKERGLEQSPYYAEATHNLAIAYKNQQKYEKVESLYKEALDIYEKLSINTDSSIDNISDDSNRHKHYKAIAIISIHLANVYRDKKKDEKYEEIEFLYQKASQALEDLKALDTYQEPLTDDIVYLYYHWVRFYYLQKEYQKAESLSLKALKISEEELPKESFSVAMIYKHLALIYNYKSEYEKAKAEIQKALRITRELRGEKDSKYANLLNDLAIIYLSQGKHKDAKSQCWQALDVYKELLISAYKELLISENLASTAEDIVTILKTLAETCKFQGCSKEDKICFQEYLNLFKTSLGEKHLYTQEVLKLSNIFK